MARVVLTAEVEDSTTWEKAYRSHGDLFKRLWDGPFPIVHYTANDNNEVAMFMEVDDLDKYFAMLERPEIAEAMKHDGVNRDSVKVYVLDKSASF